MRTYKSIMRPIMVYTIQTRANTFEMKHTVTTVEMSSLRGITGHILGDRIPSR